jgi:hypothetical protein
MGLSSIIASAVEAVRSSTEGLTVEVRLRRWIGLPLTFGGPEQFDEDVLIVPGFVQEGEVHHKRSDGQVITTKARIVFLEDVPDHGAPGRKEPIDPRDEVTLPSDLTGHLAELPGVMVNPTTGRPYTRVVWIE